MYFKIPAISHNFNSWICLFFHITPYPTLEKLFEDLWRVVLECYRIYSDKRCDIY